MTLDEWMVEHHDPAWKFRPYRVPKLGKPRGAGHDREFAQLVRDYQYQVTESIDRRTIFEPVSLDEFIARKHVAGWVPKFKLPTLGKVTKLTDAQRRDEGRRIANYVHDYNRAKVAA